LPTSTLYRPPPGFLSLTPHLLILATAHEYAKAWLAYESGNYIDLDDNDAQSCQDDSLDDGNDSNLDDGYNGGDELDYNTFD
jgi:hypothetical protein